MRARPVLAVSTSLALLGSGSALGAVGDAQDGPAAGAASSTLTLLDVGIGGTSLSVLQLALRSDTLSGSPATAAVVTPLTVGEKAYGQQSLSSRSAMLPAVDSARLAPAAVSALAAARSPLVDVAVAGGSSRLSADSLGSLSVLGMPLRVDGQVSLSSSVDSAGAGGTKTLVVSDLALPSLADMLAALGLDLRTLPTGSLTAVLDRLDLDSVLTASVEAALEQALAPVQPQLAPAQAAVVQLTEQAVDALVQVETSRAALAAAATALNDATAAVEGATGFARRGNLVGLDAGTASLPLLPALEPVLQPATDPVAPVTGTLEPVTQPVTGTLEPVTQPVAELVQDQVAPVLEAPTGAVDAVLDTVTTAPVVEPVVDALPALPEVLPLPTLPVEIPAGLQPVADAYTAAKAAYDAALQQVRDTQAALDAVNALLTDAVAKVQALLAPYQAQVDAVVDAAVGVLDATPLVSVDRLEVTTRSAVTSAATGGQVAEVVGGEVQGLRVLGTDVLQTTVGSSQVELLDLAGPVQARIDSAISDLTGALSGSLSQVPGLPTLQVPAPKVDLLARATSTDVVDGFGVAGSALRAVSVSWPSLEVPAAAALPSAGTLPGVAGAATLPALRRGSLLTTAGDVLSQPLTLSLATLEERARFRPARLSLQPGTGAPITGAPVTGAPRTGAPSAGAPTTGTPTTGTPTSGTPTTATPATGTPTTGAPQQAPPTVATGQQLPRTGTGADASVLALLLLAAGLGLQRRYRTT